MVVQKISFIYEKFFYCCVYTHFFYIIYFYIFFTFTFTFTFTFINCLPLMITMRFVPIKAHADIDFQRNI